MFNTQQIADAIATIDAKSGPTLYTPQNNHEAYMLYHYPKSGVACENLVFQTMLKHGLQADWVGDDDSHDISLYVGGRLVRVEVKSSVMHGTPARFKFHGVKPEKFDLLVLVFIHPTEGTVVKTCRKSDVENWIQSSGAKVQRDGYNINFHKSMTHKDIPTTEWHPEGGCEM